MLNYIKKQNYQTIFWMILSLAIVLRILWASAIPVIPVSDSAAYDVFAWNIAEFGTYGWSADQASSYWPVGTSALYASFYYLFGHNFWPIVIFNILVSVGTVAIVMQLSKQLFGISTAAFAGLLLAIWPSQIMYVTVLASELPFTLLVVSALYIWLKNDKGNFISALFAGILIAAASYIRPIALLLPFVFVAIEIARSKQWFVQIKALIVVLIVMTTLIFPWSVRNTNLWGEFVLISTNGPVVLWMGNHPNTDGTYTKLPEWTKSLNEYQRAQQLGKLSREYIIAEPMLFVIRSFIKVAKIHIGETIAVHWNEKGIEETLSRKSLLPLKIATQTYWTLIFLSALVGVILLIRKLGLLRCLFHPVIILWCYYASVHGVILAQDRYHFPSVPYIAILSAYAITQYLEKREERNKSE